MSLVQAVVSAAFARPPKLVLELLHVRHLPSQKGHFQTLLHINLLGAEIDDLLRRSHRSLHLITALWLLRIVADGEQPAEKKATTSAARFGKSALRRMP